MNQNIPPNPPDRSGDHADYGGNEPVDRGAKFNPYYAQQSTAQPDLDAGAPLLRSSDVQRLNRKALMFLAGIVVLLLVAVFWMLQTATTKGEQPAQPREQAVVIPELPRAQARSPVEPAPAPEDFDPYASAALPPLPLAESASPPGPSALVPPQPSGPSLQDRRMSDSVNSGERTGPQQQDAYVQAMLAGLPGSQQNDVQAATATADVTSAQFIRNPDVLLVRGTYIRCVLETRIITDVPGFTSCIVTEPIYSINGRRLLLPKGSKVLGRYDYEPSGPRVAVIWDRVTTPNGIDVAMSSPGVDNLGGAGHPGKYTAHWAKRIASALLISLISDAFKYAAAEEGPSTSTIGAGGVVVQSPYESTTARTMERLANQALEARRPPTVTINQGTVVNVYVARDVDFSDVVARF